MKGFKAPRLTEEERLQGKALKKRRAAFGLSIIVLALLTAAISFLILIGLTPIPPDRPVTIVLIFTNVAMIICLIAVIIHELYPIIKAWRARRAASKLHVRIIALFSLVAALPALVIAVIALVTLNLGLDRWFDVNTRQIVDSSVNFANAYESATLNSLQAASYTMAQQLDNRQLLNLNPVEYKRQLSLQVTGRNLSGAFLLREDRSIIVQSDQAEGLDLPIPRKEWIEEAQSDKPVAFRPGQYDYFGVILKMQNIDNAWLYVVGQVDPRVLDAFRLTEDNTNRYRDMEANRVTMQIAFAVLYFCLFLIMLLSAIWTAIAVADKLVLPIRLLIGAADDVASGNMNVLVPVRARDGDVGQLSKTFNYMVAELKNQQNLLISAKDQIDERRRFSETVLSGVSAAVIGVDDHADITIINKSAETMLEFKPEEVIGRSLISVHCEIGRVFEVARSSAKKIHREQISITHHGRARVFSVQTTMEDSKNEAHSWVVTIDDITDLIDAQRSSAWADVARRIAHEIKNPLTPIQLSAERIRRRYGKVITSDREVFDQCVDTIIRQVGDIGRMVDEFASFARMPKPVMATTDLRNALREASFLVEVSRHEIKFERDFGEEPLIGSFDNRLIGQAFGNVIKNASEAIDAVSGRDDFHGHIFVRSYDKNGTIYVDIIDNGKGLPKDDRQKLLEPYMTTREKGTGLGLAIVRKIVEEHGGYMELHDAPSDFYDGIGAMIRFIFPKIENNYKNIDIDMSSKEEGLK
ncbi:PAS domain-containing sensor histidine kinase [Bartonella sp. HY329]|uniref:sensor histidine kinase NtrY-like n=1 Tax=unclassified Bartonella TaxID=2645622 RepID=UPI0021CAA9BB|nr:MULTISPECIES: PAS domain-containing sensor histidine kinase [unclassified Bartonella]UXM93879.1 PAS domain-containing sensor histidine kinase [Bartonella sp. HY329]UXN08200.1 PAS domain-containing sensor histidine kinase [Bartonella sp. HY328]